MGQEDIMRTGSGEHTYEWIEPWANLPESDAVRQGWAHPGVAVTGGGNVVTFHPGEPSVLVFNTDGALLHTIETGLGEGHGITVTQEGEREYLWIADPGSKRRRIGSELEQSSHTGQVVKFTMDGQPVLTLDRPDLPVYGQGTYAPTSVAVNEERFGGNGDVWVADGYGQSQVHRYSQFNKRGEYLKSITGAEGSAGNFATPHGIWFDTRKTEPELYVADRGNRRVQVYDADGHFKRAFGTDFLTSPSGFARDGDHVIIAELRARLAVVDADDRLVCYLGQNESVCVEDGWPNMMDERGVPTRTNRLQPGKFNSPHGMATDPYGNIYVAEWLIGGRFIKLAKV